MPILNVDDVLHEEIENKGVLINNFEFLVEDDARNGSDNDIDNPPSVHDRPSCPQVAVCLPRAHTHLRVSRICFQLFLE